MGKKLIIGIGVIIVILIVAVGALYLFGGSAVKAAIEKLGPEMTQSKVTLGKVDISLTSGEGRMVDLFVGNPAGFDTDSAFKLGEIGVKVDVGTVTSDVIVIKEILVRAPEITLEVNSKGTNLNQIKKNIDSYVGQRGGGTSSESGGEGPKMVIEDFRIEGGKVNVNASMLKAATQTVNLPNIEIKNIGKEGTRVVGASPGEVADKVMAAINQGVAGAVKPLGIADLQGKIDEGVGAAKKMLEEGAKGKTEGVGDALKKMMGK
jgi:uncharacterized protein involved in outer membrane biogenesis